MPIDARVIVYNAGTQLLISTWLWLWMFQRCGRFSEVSTFQE